MTVVYPAYLIPDEPGYVVQVPDIGAATQGYSLAEAIFMARDLIGTMCIDLEDEGKMLPAADSVQFSPEVGTIRTLVDVDLTEYRRRNSNKVVRKNCTIPQYLCVEAEKRNINFSQLLQKALQKELEIA